MIKLMDLLKEYNINKPITTKVIEYGEDVMKEIENLGLFDFREGLLGSTGWGANYYYYYNGFNAIEGAIINGEQVKWIGPFNQVKKNLISSTIDEENWENAQEDNPNINEKTKNEFFKKYNGTYIIFSDYDNTNCGRIDVDPSNQTITIYAAPDNSEGESLIQFSDNGSELTAVPNLADYTI